MDNAPEPRRSGRHRTGNKVTATKENAIPSTTTQGSKGMVTKTSKKSSTGKLREATQEMPKTSKRKAKQNMSDSTRKKPKVEMNDLHELLVQDARQLLVPMLDIMKVIVEEFPGYSNEKWYKHLVVRYRLIPLVPTSLNNLEELANQAELKPQFIFPSDEEEETPEGSKYNYELLRGKYADLEKERQKVVTLTIFFEAAAPSEYCLLLQYMCYQNDPRTAACDGHTPLYPIPLPLEFFHDAFRIFTYWHMYPLALPADAPDPREALNTNDPQKVKFTVDREAFISICQTVNTLQCTMPEFYSSHDEHLQGFLDAILADFPHNRDDYEWHKEQAPAQDIPLCEPDKFRIDLCYRHKDTKVPCMFVEIKQDLGVGGNPFWQNHRLYQSYIAQCPAAWYNGTHLSIGGSFCDAKNKPPIVLQFGGQTNLQQDFVGMNYLEGVKKLWALRQALQLIPCELDTVDSQHEEMDIPRFRVGDKIQVTKMLFPGIIYLVKSHWEGHQRNIEDELILKIIYSGVAKERYGRVIQDHLSYRDMAPPCYQRFG
ncbi:hypothetical protein CPB84DRAFT_1755778 [Gymnopilus junonius]|uniref:Uncharacterized protein n=1 Tax=Gymnopilus junonius TaxID=109634 RepID=A0A9P5N913_GYMJU|nr:hypothetical protein CPB84DRAFT_1755778 [Gymnopilus junonius]